MTDKPTYEELKQRVKELEKDAVKHERVLEMLNENKRLLNSILESTADGILVGERDGMFSYGNSRFAEMWNIPKEVMATKKRDKLHEIISDQLKDSSAFFSSLMELYQSEDEYLDFVEFKDGRVFERFSTPLNRDGQIAGRVWSFRDITDHKRAEEALRDSEERYRLLADNIRDVIWLRDMNLNLKYISPSVMTQRGYTVEEAGARTPEEEWTPDSFKNVRDVLSEELEIEKNKQKDMHRSRTIEGEVSCKGGSTIWAEAKVSFLRDKDGEPIGIIGVTRDITERKEIEEALKKRTIQLEIEKKSLKELNTAMKILLKKRQDDKAKMEESVMANVKKLIEPYFGKIKKTRLDDQQKGLLKIVESNLNEIISPFMREVSLKHFNLTSTEIQIAKQIRYGETTKKIAQVMNISPRTVETHRKNIRRKIGLEGKKANLRSYLMSIN